MVRSCYGHSLYAHILELEVALSISGLLAARCSMLTLGVPSHGLGVTLLLSTCDDVQITSLRPPSPDTEPQKEARI